MRKAMVGVAALSALFSGAAVLQLKYSVQEHADRLEATAAQIHKDREAIRVLEAEWSYLTSPKSLQDKSIEFLALMPPAPEQVIQRISDIPMRMSAEDVDGNPSVVRQSLRKKGPANKSRRGDAI